MVLLNIQSDSDSISILLHKQCALALIGGRIYAARTTVFTLLGGNFNFFSQRRGDTLHQ